MTTVERMPASGPAAAAPSLPKVLHVLAVSIPYLNGYTMRSKYILNTQKAAGQYEPVAVTSPFYPGNPASLEDAVIDGVTYYRVRNPADEPQGWWRKPVLRPVAAKLLPPIFYDIGEWAGRKLHIPHFRRLLAERRLLRMFERCLVRHIRRLRPAVVHAHSPYRCGLPAIEAARQMRVPSVYEVRGLWDESAVAEGRWTQNDLRTRYWRRRETDAMLAADAVVCICQQLRQEVISRGVPADRVFVVPNAAEPEFFSAANNSPAPPELAPVRGQLKGAVAGYIGSVRKLEGVEELVRGTAEALRRGLDVSLLVVGDGETLKSLKALAAELGLGDRAVFPGRVPHEQIRHYYGLIDVFAITRPDSRVAQLVTPLKPLEAMAMGKALLVSDLPALRELVDEGRTGLTYRPGDVSDLADKIALLAGDEGLRRRLGAAAADWIRRERTWARSLEVLPEVYAAAAARAARRR